jgi:hypothetical protein
MCDPVSLIGGVLSLAGSAYAAQQQSAFVSAQNEANKRAYEIAKKAREAEMARQQQFENEAAGYWDKTANSLTRESHDDAQADATEEFLQTIDDQGSTQPEGQLLGGQERASDAVQTEIATRANQASAEARKRVQALAALSSYGTVDQQRNTALGETANDLTTLNSLRRGSLGVSQQEQSISPAQVTMGSSAVGDILSGVGGIVSGMGGTRVPATSKPSSYWMNTPGLY